MNRNRLSTVLLTVIVLTVSGGNSTSAATNAVNITSNTTDTATIALLRSADRARGNCDGIIWNVHARCMERGREDEFDFIVKARGFDILSETLNPPVSKGNRVLQINNNTWFYKPGIQKPLPVSVRQKMAGNAAYGDIASTNYAEDYEATPLSDAEVAGEQCQVFDLKAISGRRCTYDRIIYFISRTRQVGVKAEYYTVSGKLTRSARMDYDNKLTNGTNSLPLISRMTIYDHFVTNNLTTLEFATPTLRPPPPSTFDINRITE